MDIISFSIVDGTLRMEVSINDLLSAAKGGDPGYVVTNKKEFEDYLLSNMLETDYDSETGLSGWHRLFDSFFNEAYENGEEWLHSPFYNEMEMDEKD